MRTKTALLVGRQQFLGAYKESGLRFQRNKMWRSKEYTNPFNRPSTKTSKDQSRLLSISQYYLNTKAWSRNEQGGANLVWQVWRLAPGLSKVIASNQICSVIHTFVGTVWIQDEYSIYLFVNKHCAQIKAIRDLAVVYNKAGIAPRYSLIFRTADR